MDLASPFSLLNRLKPDEATLRAGRVLAAGVTGAVKQSVAPSADGATTRAETVGRTGQEFEEIVAQTRPSSGRAHPSAAPVSDGIAFAAGSADVDSHPPPAREPAGDRPPRDAEVTPGHRANAMAEMVVAAGFDGLDALALSPATRLASGLAQATYAALRPSA